MVPSYIRIVGHAVKVMHARKPTNLNKLQIQSRKKKNGRIVRIMSEVFKEGGNLFKKIKPNISGGDCIYSRLYVLYNVHPV